MNELPTVSLNGVEINYNSSTGESRVKAKGTGRVEGQRLIIRMSGLSCPYTSVQKFL